MRERIYFQIYIEVSKKYVSKHREASLTFDQLQSCGMTNEGLY